MIVLKEKKDCCGCGACMNVCPVNAIRMEKDTEGFLYPRVDKDRCINCGACNRVCPFITQPVLQENIKAYVGHIKEEKLLRSSSSGGIFAALANYILNQGGKVVGVGNDYKYKIVENKDELQDLYGAKYVQASTNEIFKTVKTELNNNCMLLFVGTPCVINGLKKYLIRDYKNLYTCDLICHGVPSINLLEAYKKKYLRRINKIEFRDKTNGWYNYSTILYFNNNQYKSLAVDNEYMNAYLSNMSLRESCYACQAKGNRRASDITLGDYWGIDEKDDIYNYYGNSIIIINNANGQKLLNSVKDELLIKKENIDILKSNMSYYNSAKRNDERSDFYINLNKKGFNYISQKYRFKPNFKRRLKIIIKNILGR